MQGGAFRLRAVRGNPERVVQGAEGEGLEREHKAAKEGAHCTRVKNRASIHLSSFMVRIVSV